MMQFLETNAPILVPLDGSEHATYALAVARRLAELLGADIHVVHVAATPMSPAEWRAKWRDDAVLSRAVLHVRAGDPAENILEVARERRCGIIVMCTHTGLPKPEGRMGSVADRVFRTAPCPVILVRPDRRYDDWQLRTVLLPHDATPASALAIAPARRLIERAGAKMIVLHVRDMAAPPPQEPGAIPPPQYVDQAQYEWPAWAQEFLDRLGRETDYAWLHANVRLVLGEGSPAEAVLRTARERDADLIACAWHGTLDPQHAETLKRMIAATPCPLLIMRV